MLVNNLIPSKTTLMNMGRGRWRSPITNSSHSL